MCAWLAGASHFPSPQRGPPPLQFLTQSHPKEPKDPNSGKDADDADVPHEPVAIARPPAA